MNQIQKLAEWLKSCDAHDVQHVTVTINGESWPACRYKRTLQYTQGMTAVQWGEKKAGDTYTEDRIYCIGALPKCYGKSGGACFPFENLDWYVAAYMPLKNLTPQVAEYHPLGISFILGPWDIPGETIDKYEPKPYRRYPMTVVGV